MAMSVEAEPVATAGGGPGERLSLSTVAARNLATTTKSVPQMPVSGSGTTAIVAMRTGEDDAGVIGLRRTGPSGRTEPGLNVRFGGIDAKGILSYQVSAYYSAAVLVPDALGVLENVELGR
jgi:hypothetical protein